MAVCPSVAISAALGGEGFGHIPQFRPEFGQHVAHHVVTLDQQTVSAKLARSVAIADVPREADEVGAFDLQQILNCGLDRDQTTVLQFEDITIVEGDGLGEVDEEVLAIVRGQQFAAQEAFVIGKGDGTIGGRVCVGYGGGAGHGGQNIK